LFNIDNYVLLCLCYNVPRGSAREIFNDVTVFDLITDDITSFESQFPHCNFIICGDFNSIGGVKPDYVKNKSMHLNDLMPDKYTKDLPLPIQNQDKVVNTN